MLEYILNYWRINRRVRRKLSPYESGMTLLELIIACAILMVLSSAALPIAKYSIIRQREAELHRDLRVQRPQAGLARAVEAQLAVGDILDDQHAIPPAQPDQCLPAGQGLRLRFDPS